eukprot:Sspe_Gene.95435::Locus_67723_Transcript_1_1_Confidence_1.000_Length_2037::g.95435::m.95435
MSLLKSLFGTPATGARRERVRPRHGSVSGKPKASEVESLNDVVWLKEHPAAAELQPLWSRVPAPGVDAPTDEDPELCLTSINWVADHPSPAAAGPAFRKHFLHVMRDWEPSPPHNVVLPICFLGHFVDALKKLVDALSRVDTSIPRGRAPTQYQAVESTLECLTIACRSAHNVRYLVNRGLFSELSKLMEAVVTGLWPLVLPMACLRENARAAAACGREEAQPDYRLDDKQAQVQLRVKVFALCVKILHQATVTPKVFPTYNPTSSLRVPLIPHEEAAACHVGTPCLSKVVSWSLVMMYSHVMPELPSEEVDLFEVLDTLIAVVGVICRNTVLEDGRTPDPAPILDAEIPSALTAALTWPVECNFRHSQTGALASDDPAVKDPAIPFDPALYVSPKVSLERVRKYSSIQLHTLRIVADLLEYYPAVMKDLIDANFFNAVKECTVWHIYYFSPPDAAQRAGEKLRKGLTRDFLSNGGAIVSGASKTVSSYQPIKASLMDLCDVPVGPENPSLLDVVQPRMAQIGDVLDSIMRLSIKAYRVREYAHGRASQRLATQSRTAPKDEAALRDEQDDVVLWQGADMLEFLCIEIFSGLFNDPAPSTDVSTPHSIPEPVQSPQEPTLARQKSHSSFGSRVYSPTRTDPYMVGFMGSALGEPPPPPPPP